jgi:hypothetical protein
MSFAFRLAAVKTAVLTAGLALASAPASAAVTCSWSMTPSVSPGSQNRLNGISADSATDAWAVGFYLGSTGSLRSLAEHWNGKTWALTATRSASAYDNVFNGVSADSSTDAWAVGYYYTGSINEPLIEHWNGKVWAGSPGPNVGGTYGALFNAVVALSPTNVWAVGQINTSNNGNTQALIEHWNGAKWAVVATPNKTSIEDTLTGISAVNANDIWIGGVYSTTSPGFDKTLAEHWNGTAWSIVTTVDETSSSSNINAIGVLATNDVWATGDYFNKAVGANGEFRTLVQKWNGATWAAQGSGNIASDETDLSGIAAVSPTEILAIGSYVGTYRETFVEWYDGSGVRITTTLNPGAYGNYFDAGSTIPKTSNAWAAGGTLSSSGYVDQALIELFTCT